MRACSHAGNIVDKADRLVEKEVASSTAKEKEAFCGPRDAEGVDTRGMRGTGSAYKRAPVAEADFDIADSQLPAQHAAVRYSKLEVYSPPVRVISGKRPSDHLFSFHRAQSSPQDAYPDEKDESFCFRRRAKCDLETLEDRLIPDISLSCESCGAQPHPPALWALHSEGRGSGWQLCRLYACLSTVLAALRHFFCHCRGTAQDRLSPT